MHLVIVKLGVNYYYCILGIGKTTLISGVCRNLEETGIPVKGFYTAEVREKGERVGFNVVDLTSSNTAELSRIE